MNKYEEALNNIHKTIEELTFQENKLKILYEEDVLQEKIDKIWNNGRNESQEKAYPYMFGGVSPCPNN